jgi:MSHA biogenesis protein MshL
MNQNIIKILLSPLFIVGISSCQVTPKNQTNTLAVDTIKSEIENSHTQKSNRITEEQALSSITFSDELEPETIDEHFDVSVKNVDIHDFLLGLVDSTQYNLIASPDLNLTVSLQLKNVTVPEVLHAVSQIYPITIKQNQNLYLISSAETTTTIYNLDYLNIKRSGKSKTSVSGKPVANNASGNSQNGNQSNRQSNQSQNGNNLQENSTSIETINETDFWTELNTSLNLIIKGEKKASVVISPQSGIIVVRALPQTQSLIKNYLRQSQDSLNRQVVIEAKIIEVQLNEGFQSGVDWNKVGYLNNGRETNTFSVSGQTLEQPTASTPLNGLFSFLYKGQSFAAAIELLKSQGDVQVLSSPRVSTINNQKAVIKVGTDEFFVTDVSTTTVTGTSTSTTPDVTLTPFFSGISLDVTPQINQHGDIILHIHPVVSEVSDQTKILSLGEDILTLPLALSNVRESDSIVKAKNGQVIVIGGLMQNTVSDQVTSTPVLGDIPLLGNLFRQTRQKTVKSELVILLKAQVVDLNDNESELDRLKYNFSQF